MPHRAIEVIIPARDMADQLPQVLRPLRDQLCAADRVTVVNDASNDDTEAVALGFGAQVINLADSRGPYFARQVAGQGSTADILLFIDGRCRPLPGLLDAHRTLQDDPRVALSCTDVRTISGPTLAARVAELKQPFRLDGAVGVPGRPDFYPTANLGVDRDAFIAVGGFRQMRSGGDADLCWRIQGQSVGILAADRRVLMEWVPRADMRDLLSQYNRYGASTAYLQHVHGDHSPAPYAQDRSRLTALLEELRKRRAWRRATAAEWLGRAAVNTAFQYGYLQAKLKKSDGAPASFPLIMN